MNGTTPGAGLSLLEDDQASWALLHVAVGDIGHLDHQFPFPIHLGLHPGPHHSRVLALPALDLVHGHLR